ncbi:smarcal1, partial [Acrasis kona]
THCEKHQIDLVRRQVKKEGPNQGKYFVVCPSENNCCFYWDTDQSFLAAKSQPATQATQNMVSNTKGYAYEVHFEMVSSSYGMIKQDQGDEPEGEDSSLEQEHATITFKEIGSDCLLVRLPKQKAPAELVEKELVKLNGERRLGDYLFPWNDYDKVKDTLLKSTAPINIYMVPSSASRLISSFEPVVFERDEKDVNWDKLPTRLRNSLRPFQKQGVIFGVKRQGRLLIGDEMGLGKTIQAISIAQYYRDEWPLLVICPSSLRYNWSNELEQWLMPHIRSEDINICLTGRHKLTGLVDILSYDLAVRMDKKIEARNYKVIILDESHYIKNGKTQRSRTLQPLITCAKRVVLI